MKRNAVLVAALALLVAACGGSGLGADENNGGEVTTTEAPDATTVESDDTDTPATTMPPPDDDSGGESPGEANVAIVTIGNTTWEFDANPEGPIIDCNPDFFGAFWVVGETADGDSLNLLPTEGDANFEDPPSVRVVDRAIEADWTADETLIDTANYSDVLAEGDSQVDSFTVDGNTASGTATFVDENQIFAVLGGSADAVEPVSGSFDVSCGG